MLLHIAIVHYFCCHMVFHCMKYVPCFVYSFYSCYPFKLFPVLVWLIFLVISFCDFQFFDKFLILFIFPWRIEAWLFKSLTENSNIRPLEVCFDFLLFFMPLLLLTSLYTYMVVLYSVPQFLYMKVATVFQAYHNPIFLQGRLLWAGTWIVVILHHLSPILGWSL